LFLQAERVAAELGEQIGGTVGYQIRLENRQSAKTRLLFCTTGVRQHCRFLPHVLC
jgi:HrpA-like RNA helicase